MKSAFDNLSLDLILSETYIDKEGLNYAKKLLDTYELKNTLITFISQIKRKSEFTNGKLDASKLEIGSIASGFISAVNSRITKIDNEDEKHKIKIVIRDVAFYIIRLILDHANESSLEIIQQISSSSYDSIEIHGYDKKDFESYVPLNMFSSLTTHSYEKSVLIKPVYYDWNGYPHDLDDLAKNLKSKGLKSVKEFKKMFDVWNERFTITFDASGKETLIILFDELFNRKLITPRGNKGHFHPLKILFVDLEGKFLFEKEQKSLKYTIKKNKSKYHDINTKVIKWIKDYKVK